MGRQLVMMAKLAPIFMEFTSSGEVLDLETLERAMTLYGGLYL